MIKKIITSKKFWIGLIIAAQFLALIYFFGGQWIRNDRARNFNTGVIWVFEQAKKLGQVSYTNQVGEQIILILQP